MYIVVDGNTIAHRVWHSPPVNGKLEGAGWEDTLPLFLLSYCEQIAKIVERIDKFRPKFTKMVVCWDGKEAIKLRREIFPGYKLKRQEARAEESSDHCPYQLIDATRQAFTEVCGRYGVYHIAAEGDDLIALLCEVLQGEQVCIVTGDNDMYQCITQEIRIFDPFTNKVIGPGEVQEKYGVPPEKIPELKSLMGDSSDNYPGIKGIGPKKAVGLIGTYSKVQFPEVETYLKLATIPFEKLDTNSVLEELARIDLDSPPNWCILIDKFGLGDRTSARLSFVV